MISSNTGYILALDVGERRIGTAIASTVARLARPFGVIENTSGAINEIVRLIEAEHITEIVVGLPRTLMGHESAQTKYVRSFAAELRKHTTVTVSMQDEALTSRQAEAELRSRKTKYSKADIDALAATFILEDYLIIKKTKGNLL